MILTDSELQRTLEMIERQEKNIANQRGRLKNVGRTPAEIKRLMDPQEAFLLQLKEEVEHYSQLKEGVFNLTGASLENIGELLISARIVAGLSQRDLAERTGTNEAQVTRDERHEYHGATVDRTRRIFEALGLRVKIHLVHRQDSGTKKKVKP